MDEAQLIFNLEKFRTYSKGATTADANVVGATALTNGGVSKTTSDGGAVSKTVTSTSLAKTTSSATSSSGGRTTVSTTSNSGGYSSKSTSTNSKYGVAYTLPINPGSSSTMAKHTHPMSTTSFNHTHSFTTPSHTHSVSVTVPNHTHNVSINIPGHSHNVTYNVPAHSHKIDITGHTHTVNVTIPSHSHEVIHGIYDYPNLAQCDLYIDGVRILENVAGDRNINIAQYIKKDGNGSYGGTHTLEVRSKSTTHNPQGLGRANVSIFISGFVSF